MVCYQSAPGDGQVWNVVDVGDRLQRKNADLKSLITTTRKNDSDFALGCNTNQYSDFKWFASS